MGGEFDGEADAKHRDRSPVEKVIDYAKDVGRLWRSWPEEVAARDVELKPDGVGSSARLFGHVLGIHMEGTVEYTEVVPNERIVAKIHWFGESPTWVFSFDPAKGGTKLTAEGEWQVKAPVVGTRRRRDSGQGPPEAHRGPAGYR